MKLPLVQGPSRVRASLLLKEALTAGRFALVGLAATAVHLGIAWLLVGKLSVPALEGNTCAFLVAFAISFCGHYFWTFGRPGQVRQALRRFFGVSLLAFLFNTLLLASLIHVGVFSPVVATVVSAALVPAISFVLSRLWCFVER